MADEDRRESPFPEGSESREQMARPRPPSSEGSRPASRQTLNPESRPGSAAKSASRPASAVKTSSRPASAASDKPLSRPTSAKKPASEEDDKALSRPGSAQKTPPRPMSAKSEEGEKTASRPASAKKTPSRPSSAKVEEGERTPSRSTSAKKPASLPMSAHDEEDERTASRPGSAVKNPSRRTSAKLEEDERSPSRPVSAKKSPPRPDSGAGEASSRPASRPRSAAKTPSRPVSAAGEEPTQSQSRPASAQQPSSRPGSAAQEEQSAARTDSRPASAAKTPSRPSSGQRGSRPTSGRPTSASPPSTTRSLISPQQQPGDRELVEEEEEGTEGMGEGGTGEAQEEAGQDQLLEDDFPPLDNFTDNNALISELTGGGGGGGGGGPSDDDDGDGGGDEDEDEEIGDETDLIQAGEESDEVSENETEMVVLDPDHPLMKRFQKALNTHLSKQDYRLMLELRELDASLKQRRKERESLGVELYGVQQELARYQMALEQTHDKYTEISQIRVKGDHQLVDIRVLYKDACKAWEKEKDKVWELTAEVENLNLRIYHMESAKKDVRGDISIMRRAAEKVESQVARSEIEKQKQDLYVDRLTQRLDKLKEELAMYEAQILAQTEETKAAKESLMEAYMEMEAIGVEKKQLFQQWSSSLIGMRRRDEAHAAMQEALRQQQQKILSLDTELQGFKRNINKEQEYNEKLTLILTKTERDIESVKKQLTVCQNRFDALKKEFTTYTRMLHETESALNRAIADKTLRENDVTAIMKQIEREYQEKITLEDQIMERLRTQLTLDKAYIYTKKLTRRTRNLTKELESQMAQVENSVAHNTLETVNVNARIERLNKIKEDCDKEITEKLHMVDISQHDIKKRNSMIERKQNMIDIYNKKLESMIVAAGGQELGPLELEINAMVKTIDARVNEITELQQLWLRRQNELVRLSQDLDSQTGNVEMHKRQLTIISQKKIRTECEIEAQKREIHDTEKSMRVLRTDVIKVNTLLGEQKKFEAEMDTFIYLKENDFIFRLQDAERESIQMAAKLEGVKEEKERLLNSLVEAERQIMLWEKKTQLARETRDAVHSDTGAGEVYAMKSEIHRMTVRHQQLMKMQEKMIQEMEKSVSRRDTICMRAEAQAKMKYKPLTKGTYERQMLELRKKIKKAIQEAGSCDGDIKELRESQADLSKNLDEKQVICQMLQGHSDTLDGDIEQMLELKQSNLSTLVAKQQRQRFYQQAKEGSYTFLCRTPSAIEQEESKQEARTQALSAIVDRLNQEFPHAQTALRKASQALASRS